ncbi:MAG TPA: ATP-binding protein [Pontiella sp.]
MDLKRKILITLFIVSLLIAVVTGGILVFLLNLHEHIQPSRGAALGAMFLAIALCLSCVLTLFILLTRLLEKHAIVPIAERDMMDKERAMLTEQLHHSQKMEAVGRLAGSIAHDFNNLLTIIDGYTSLIISDPKGDEIEQHAQEVVKAARKASFITRKLLGFSQKEKSAPELLDLNTTLEDTEKMLTRLIGEKITLITKPAPKPIYCMTDPVQMGQVLMNLAVNARDAMPNGGRIIIKIDSRHVNDGECNKSDNLPAGEYAQISVHDTGTGMDEETLEHIFEAFFTTKKAGKGTGLGLSIVKSIMKECEGFIDVTSKINGGTTFMIYLPLKDEPIEETLEVQALSSNTADGGSAASVTEVEKQAAGDEAREKATILLVEDDEMIRTLVAQTLELQGYHVLVADEGWEGIKVVRTYKGKIDLLFTDVVMPGMGGVELAVATQELNPGIKVLYMSGYSRSQLHEEGVPADAALLEKPFTPDKVVGMVRQMLG